VRPSYFVLKYLIDKGYKVFPVNPGQAGKEILGRPVYASLKEIPEPLDMVDIFRGAEAVPGIVEEVLALDPLPKVVWMQLGIRHDEAAIALEEAGLKVVMNRCPKMEYGKLSGEWNWVGGYSGRCRRSASGCTRPARCRAWGSHGPSVASRLGQRSVTHQQRRVTASA
jgi:uncharacterized protein